MLGTALDYVAAKCERKRKDSPEPMGFKQIKTDGALEDWIYFVPGAVARLPGLGKLLKVDANIDAYITAKSVVQTDPKKTRAHLEGVAQKAIEDYKNKNSYKKPNVLAISIGNCPAYMFANEIPVNRFVSVVPGSSLPECIRDSQATGKIFRASNKPFEEYKKELNHLGPISNLDYLKTNNLELHVGDSDLFIPSKYGDELVNAIREKGIAHTINLYKNAGHVEALLRFADRFAHKQRRKDDELDSEFFYNVGLDAV